MTLRSYERANSMRRLQFFAISRFRDSDRRSEIGRLHEHRETQVPRTPRHRSRDTTRYSTTGSPRSLATRFIISLSIEMDEASTPAPT